MSLSDVSEPELDEAAVDCGAADDLVSGAGGAAAGDEVAGFGGGFTAAALVGGRLGDREGVDSGEA